MSSQNYGSMDSASADNTNRINRNELFPNANSRDIEAVHEQFRKDGKRPVRESNISFLTTTVVGIPLFLSLLPLTLLTLAGKSIFPDSSSTEIEDSRIASSQESTGEIFPEMDQIVPKKERKYDVVQLGCTGYTGRLAAIYIAKTYGVNKGVRWAIAGRSQAKLNKLKEELAILVPNCNISDLDIIIVDTTQPETIHGLVKDTKAVISSAGPFWKYGSKVVEFCVKYGTDYVDTTGETGWNKEMIMKWNSIALKTGSKIISLCGMDSMPWDLSFYKLSQLVMERDNDDHLVKAQFFDEIKGGISGGTIDTMLSVVIDQKYKEERYQTDPYYLSPDGTKKIIHKTKDTSPAIVKSSPQSDGRWTMPWLMGIVNGEVVKRSNALLMDSIDTSASPSIPKNLEYQEYWVHPTFKEAFGMWFRAIIAATALFNPFSGTLMRKYVLPKPGDGPDEKSISKGYLLLNAIGESKNGIKVESSLYYPNDPGYGDTARMVAESGLCLALDEDKLSVKGGGFYTPAIGMGDALLERLCCTGCKFASRIIDEHPKSKL